VIKEGALWQARSGDMISIWRDRWIPSLPHFRLSCDPAPTEDAPVLVSELIDQEVGFISYSRDDFKWCY
jgi:hypothetical protein